MNVAHSISSYILPVLVNGVFALSIFGYNCLTNTLCNTHKSIVLILILVHLYTNIPTQNRIDFGLNLTFYLLELGLLCVIVHRNLNLIVFLTDYLMTNDTYWNLGYARKMQFMSNCY